MTATRPASNAIRFAVTGALAGVLLAGCASSGNAPRLARGAAQGQPAEASGKADRAVALAEAAVERSSSDAGLRIALAQAYLKAGRFESAATTFEDAMELGDNSGRSALGLALSYVAVGRSSEAVAVLDERRDAIPASDLGLAYALSGETSRGVAILADALRAGDASSKLRQNLAYAYALDGRWREARLMMAQDVPADQIDSRISEWAMQAKPEDHQKRVASLLGAPLRTDSGQPQHLALTTGEPAEPQTAQAVAAAEPEARTALAWPAELPPVNPNYAREVEPNTPTQTISHAPFVDPAAAAAAQDFEKAFVEPVHGVEPEAQPAPVRTSHPVRAVAERQDRDAPIRDAVQSAVSNGSHAVQLGSFSSPENARRAVETYKARYPKLRDSRMSITQAVVNGKNFWRVAVEGFSSGSARGMCSSVKARGGDCFAYSTYRGLPGSLQGGDRIGSGPQRARR